MQERFFRLDLDGPLNWSTTKHVEGKTMLCAERNISKQHMEKDTFESDFEMTSPMTNNFTGQEGFERGRRAEFHQFLSTAKASCAELRSQLYVAYDIGYLNQGKFNQLLGQAEEVGRIIGGLRVSVEKQKKAMKAKINGKSRDQMTGSKQ
jgi:four helix bundle protein